MHEFLKNNPIAVRVKALNLLLQVPLKFLKFRGAKLLQNTGTENTALSFLSLAAFTFTVYVFFCLNVRW